MIIPDVNLLLYAYDAASPYQAKAAAWWQGCLDGVEPVGLPHVVVFGFLRIGTNARAFQQPFSVADAAGHVRSWLAQPVVHLLAQSPNHVEQVLQLLESVGSGGNLVADAQIAAFALDYGAVLHTADSDFLRFQGLRWFNPITNTGSGTARRKSAT